MQAATLPLTGKAASPLPTPAHYSPGEVSSLLLAANINRTERWVRQQCHAGAIKTNPAFAPNHMIPESEVRRLITGDDGS